MSLSALSTLLQKLQHIQSSDAAQLGEAESHHPLVGVRSQLELGPGDKCMHDASSDQPAPLSV